MSARQPRAFHSLRGLRSLTAPWGMPAVWAGEPSMDGSTQPRLCGHGVSPACWPACCGSNSCLALRATGGRGCQKPCQSSAWNLLGVTTRAPPPSPDVPEPQLELTRSRLTPGVLGPPYQGRPAGWARAPRSPPLPLWDLEQQALLSVPSLGCHRTRSGSRPKARSSPLGGSGGTGDALPHPCSRDHSSVRESAVSAWTSGVPGCDREGQARGGRRLCVKRRFEQDRKCGVAGVWKEL